jgi:uncharacterized protein (UPF0548 family)
MKPSVFRIKKVLEEALTSEYTYSEVGFTECDNTIPKGYSKNHYLKFLGVGKDIFNIGKSAVSKGKMYQLKSLELHICNEVVELEQGTVMAVVARHFGIWSINPIRVVYIVDRTYNDYAVFSLAVGTLGGHEEKGEERFSVRLSSENKVYYEIFSFNTPAGILPEIAYPLERIVLHSFARNSANAIAQFVKSNNGI